MIQTFVIDDLTKDQRTKHVFELNNKLQQNLFQNFMQVALLLHHDLPRSFCVFNSKTKNIRSFKSLRMLADQFIDLYESTKEDYEVKTKKQPSNGKQW